MKQELKIILVVVIIAITNWFSHNAAFWLFIIFGLIISIWMIFRKK